jgi:pyruvate/2-oxoglutarate dehydrogenase complex dihydrolipoamide dehydrogenase (E3) component
MTTFYDDRRPYDNYDASTREWDAIFIGGGASGRFGSSYFRAMGGNQLTIEMDNHLGGKCCKNACVLHHYLYEIAVELDKARIWDKKEYWPKFPHKNGKVEILPILRDYLVGREYVFDFMFHQSKEQLNIQFMLNQPASIIDPHTVKVAGKGEFKTRNIIVAAGAGPSMPNLPGVNLKGVYTYATFLELDYEPKDVVVVGASKSGLPWACFFNAVGCNTTVVEMMPALSQFPIDDDTRDYTLRMMSIRGLPVLDETTLISINGDGNVKSVTVKGKDGQEKTIKCDLVYMATGCTPRSELVTHLGVKTGPKKEILVNKHMATNVPGILASGDITGGVMEMWKARQGGMLAAKNILGNPTDFETDLFCDTVHTFYETTWVGMTEKEAKEKVGQVFVARMPINGYKNWLPLPLCEGTMQFAHQWTDLSGFQKIIYDAKTRKFLGAQHVGYGGKDAFQYLLYMLKQGATIDDISNLTELFINPTHFIQLSRLRAGMKHLIDLG